MKTYIANIIKWLQRLVGSIGNWLKNNPYTLFKMLLVSVETVLNISGLQLLDGETISNALLIPMALSISVAMLFSASHLGESLLSKNKVSIYVAIGLGLLLHGALAWMRIAAKASYILICLNLGFYATVSVVAYLRAVNQDYFQRDKMISKLVIIKGDLDSNIQSLENQKAFVENSFEQDAKLYAKQQVEEELRELHEGLRLATNAEKKAKAYLSQRKRELTDIQNKALSIAT